MPRVLLACSMAMVPPTPPLLCDQRVRRSCRAASHPYHGALAAGRHPTCLSCLDTIGGISTASNSHVIARLGRAAAVNALPATR